MLAKILQSSAWEAVKCFQNSNIQITTEGRRYLGSTLGTIQFTEVFVHRKVAEWEKELKKLS
jgi:hypothetical protein